MKRSDYILRVTNNKGKTSIVLWEFLSHWKHSAILSLCDYSVRALLKFSLPVNPVVLLLSPSPQAKNTLKEGGLSFQFTLVRLYEMLAVEFVKNADIHLLPFVPVMKAHSEAVWEAEKRIYTSSLPSEEKADLLTAMAIFAGLKDKNLARQLVERRRDLMIQSYTYEIIKQEGIQEERINSRRKAISDVLEVHLGIVPLDVIQEINSIDEIQVLEELHRKAVIVNDMQEFRGLLKQVLKPA